VIQYDAYGRHPFSARIERMRQRAADLAQEIGRLDDFEPMRLRASHLHHDIATLQVCLFDAIHPDSATEQMRRDECWNLFTQFEKSWGRQRNPRREDSAE
jgi:hypothetical protein